MKASDQAYTQLRQDIIGWSLQPGSVLSEVEQAARLGVSRTPVREALSRLAADGLVRTEGRGVVVSSISAEDLSSLFELRQSLELTAVRLAAQRSSAEDFSRLERAFAEQVRLLDSTQKSVARYYTLVADMDHQIEAAAANRYLSTALAQMRPHLQRFRSLAQDNQERLRASALEHAAICRGIAEHDADLAAAALTLHLRSSLNYIRSAFNGHDPGGSPLRADDTHGPDISITTEEAHA